jgi:cystathionine beta-synthase
MARTLLKEEGILAGSSTGTLLAAALRYCRDQKQPKRVVTFACDTGSRYLSKLFNDFWMEDQGFIRREHHGDLRDLIGRPHDERATITVGPNDIVTTAHNRLRNAGISQLPVLDSGRLIGVLTEEDIMRFAFGHLDRLSAPVREAMQTAFISVPKEMPVTSLVSILQVAPYAVVLDGEKFCGLITRADVLNYLRREVQS